MLHILLRKWSCRRNILLWLIIVGCLTVVSGCGFDSTFRASKELTLQMKHMPGSPLEVESRNGSVEVIADAMVKEVSVKAVLTCRGSSQSEADQRLADSRLIAERGVSGKLVIKPIFSTQSRSGDGAKITVRLPDADGVKVNTSNGRVSISGTSGEVYVDTSNGRVNVLDHQGKVHIDTSNGSVQVTGAVGPLFVDTSNGSVEAHDVTGKTTIDTSNGSITFSLSDSINTPIHLDTSNASITAEIDSAFSGTIRLDTSNGRVRVDNQAGIPIQQTLKKTEGTVVIGEGSTISIMDTSNGNITLIIR